MYTSKNLTYGVAALVAGGVALVAGVPAYLLLIFVCPVMMFFMMSSMSGGNTRGDADVPETEASTKTKATVPDGSHDRL